MFHPNLVLNVNFFRNGEITCLGVGKRPETRPGGQHEQEHVLMLLALALGFALLTKDVSGATTGTCAHDSRATGTAPGRQQVQALKAAAI